MNRNCALRIGAALVVSLSAHPLLAARQGPEPPAPELKKLEFLAGKYSGKGKMYVPGGAAVDWTMKDEGQWVLGGQFLRTVSKAEFPGVGAEDAVEMIGYDNRAKVFRLWRYSSMGGSPTEAEGKFDGARLVMLSKPDASGGVYRAMWEPKSGSQVYFLLEMKTGDKYEKMIEMTSTPMKP